MTRVLVTGASGFVGTALVAALRARGDEVLRLTRTPREGSDVAWDPQRRTIDATRLDRLDAVVHLAGENVAKGRWTKRKKQRLVTSRIDATRFLCETLARLTHKPRVVVSASAIGFYGDRGDETVTEASPPGRGFLAELCVAWERATEPLSAHAIRVVHIRIGLVLARHGGALRVMLVPFRLGIGGRLGSGRQWLSWIALPDLVAAIVLLLEREDLSGAFLGVAPGPVTNATFSKTLGRVLHRPAVCVVPAFVARLLFGEFADEALLASTRALPERLLAAGFRFGFPSLEGALAR